VKHFLAMFFTLGLIACPSNAPDPGPATDTTIGASGGTVSSNGKATLVIPAGAITTAGKWKIVPVVNSTLPVLSTLEPYELVDGSAYEVQADNPALSKDAQFSTDTTGLPTTPAPNVFIGYDGASNRSVQQMGGVAIDASGTVWVNNETTNAVLGFTPASLATTGTPEATIMIDNATTNPGFGGLAFSY
jgi:hypothetical protein